MPSTNTLTIPAKYVDDLRAALAIELADEAGIVAEARSKWLESARLLDDDKVAWHRDEVESAMTLLAADAEMMTLAGPHGDGPLTLPADDPTGCLAHVLGVMADKVVAPRLTNELCDGGFDNAAVEKVRTLTSQIVWAAEAAAEVNYRRPRPDAVA